jgi:hypothetical protein
MSHMKEVCPGTEPLARWVEGDRDPSVTAHLAACDDCRRAVVLSAGLDAPPVRAMDAVLLARVVSAARRRPAWPWAAAASVLVALGASLWLGRSEPAPRPAPPAPDVARHDPPAPVPVIAVKEPVLLPTRPVPPPPLPDPAPVPAPTPVPAPKPEPKPEPPRPAEPAPVAKPEVRTETDLSAVFAPVFVVDPTGDLWLTRDAAGSSKPGAFERVAHKDRFTARGVPAAFALEGKASIVLDKGAQASVSYFKPDQAYALRVFQGPVLVDTEGASQRWQISAGKAELSISNFKGRIAIDPRPDDGVAAIVLEGRGDLKSGSSTRKLEPGREVALSADGKLDERKAETARVARLSEFRPRWLTAFAVTFEEDREKPLLFPYAVQAGRTVTEAGSTWLLAQGPAVEYPKAGEKIPVTAAFKPETPLRTAADMIVRFRYRTTFPAFTVRLGKFSAPFASKARPGQWAEGEIPVRSFTHEGVPMVPSDDEVTDVQFSVLPDRKDGKLELDGVQFLRRAR